MDTSAKRNVVIVGHGQCGKTTLSESMLFSAKIISRKGEVAQGNTVSDFNEDERVRKFSINASYMHADYNAHKIQIIDTPGYADFIGEAIATIRVADCAVVVVDAINGIEVVTDEVWQMLDNLSIPRIIFINKVDKEGAKPQEVLSDIKSQLSKNAVLIDFSSSELIESVAESDDALLEKYLDKGTLDTDELKSALRKAVLQSKVFPVIMGNALTDKGVKELLDYIIAYMPNPLERGPYKIKGDHEGEAEDLLPSEAGPFYGYIFKIIYDSHLGQLAFMKVLKGSCAANSDCFNATKNSKEHIGIISLFQGKDHTNMEKASVGDIVALTKLKNTSVNDVLSSDKAKIELSGIVYPEPSISASVKPKTRSDEEKIGNALHKLCEEDLTFKVNRNVETKELIISGIGDLHIKILLERMKVRYNVEVETGKPKVTYRETISKKARYRHKYKKQSGGRGQYGDVDLEVEPLPGTDYTKTQYEFVNAIFGGAIPRNFIPSIEKGVKQTLEEGVLAGYPLYNVKVTVVDGSYHDVDSSDIAFQIASIMAMKEAVKTAGPIILEPIMEVSVVTTGEFIGQISGDMSSRRGRIMGQESRGKKEVLKAHVPLSELYTYANDLRSITGGRGSYTMKFYHYEPAPMKVTEHVIAEYKESKKE
ncbi:MAG: elongation factor G [Candidatus Omnitrophica bacterium]|nr:elongation factor G [Candidatus Omnitrophota bacterium]